MIKYLKHKEFKRMHGYNCQGTHELDKNGKHVITVPYHVSTMTRLHEIAHQNNKDNGNCNITIDHLFDKELKAELFAYKCMNREVNINILKPAIETLVHYVPNYSNYIFNIAIKKLKEYDIPYCKEERSNLWHAIKKSCKQIKSERNGLP